MGKNNPHAQKGGAAAAWPQYFDVARRIDSRFQKRAWRPRGKLLSPLRGLRSRVGEVAVRMALISTVGLRLAHLRAVRPDALARRN
jgi:hypothetical protein